MAPLIGATASLTRKAITWGDCFRLDRSCQCLRWEQGLVLLCCDHLRRHGVDPDAVGTKLDVVSTQTGERSALGRRAETPG